MHDHDIDRIAAVAEGRLTGDELATAETEVRSCSQCLRELEDQRLAIAFLRNAPAPEMTGLERATLHRAVRQATAPRSSRLLRLVPAFAAAAALVMVFGVVTLFRGGGASESAMQVTDQLSTTLPIGQPPAAPSLGKSGEDAATEESTAREMAEAPAVAVQDDELVQLAATLRGYSEPVIESMECDDEARARQDQEPLAVARVTIEGTDALLYVYMETAAVFDLASCEFLREVPPQ